MAAHALHHGSCLDIIPTLTPGSITSIVTDPPYGLSFMGADWDHQVPPPAHWAAMLTVVTPGALLLAFGGTRTWHRLACSIEDAGWLLTDSLAWLYGTGWPKAKSCLKPGHEPIILARAPGPGPIRHLNIDGCRIGQESTRRTNQAEIGYGGGNTPEVYQTGSDQGRWPANVILDDEAAALLDRQSGERKAGSFPAKLTGRSLFGLDGHEQTPRKMNDAGGASRFFYCTKPSRRERTLPDGRRNPHPTPKPVDLMRWLVRLVKQPGHNTILDPYCGSGSTLVAASMEGCDAVGIDRDFESTEISTLRLSALAA